MSQVEPMTAAEYRGMHGGTIRTDGGKRILAALEERERLLGEREARKPKGLVTADEYAKMLRGEQEIFGSDVLAALRYYEANATDAALGALVRRIREHPMGQKMLACVCVNRLPLGSPIMRDYFDLNEERLAACLSHLDSLLPKEPEVWSDNAPSGKRYQVRGDELWALGSVDTTIIEERVTRIPCEDAPVVAKLMESAKESGK